MKTAQNEICPDEIASRAYEIWQRRGCPTGDGQQDWQAAEMELRSERVSRGTSTQERMQSWWERMRQKLAGQQR